jgi:hypothetical protein
MLLASMLGDAKSHDLYLLPKGSWGSPAVGSSLFYSQFQHKSLSAPVFNKFYSEGNI